MISKSIGIVIIGRNEGERLQRCLKSVVDYDKVVYVDSGSSDNSVSHAKSLGVLCVDLDMGIPFSAGRARNAGFQHLNDVYPQIKYIQFIDGDCEISKNWLDTAKQYLDSHPDCAIVAGHLKERSPEESIYNWLNNIEWATPVGEVKACGGLFMIRKRVFQSEGGFNPEIVAGEEPDLCYRIRNKKWKIVKIDQLMAMHDSDMTKFSQWWQRMIRNGYGAIDVMSRIKRNGILLGETPFTKMVMSAQAWTFGWLLLALSAYLLLGISGVGIAALIWLLQALRISFKWRAIKNVPYSKAVIYGFFVMISKWPQMLGQLKYFLKPEKSRRKNVFDYK